ncbi:MAG: serine hydrolase [Bacteroidota bacterium]
MLRLLLSAFFLCPVCLGLYAQTSVIDSLDEALQKLALEEYFSGNLLLAEGGKVLLRKSYGFSDFANKTPLRENAILELASVSKQFTAAAVALLAKEEKIDLDAPIADYLPELAAYPEVTTRQLVHHTGGLPDYMSMAEKVDDASPFVTNQFALDVFRDEKPEREFAPGEKFSYSNSGYLILASLVERVSKQPFGDFMRERVFVPLGMTDSQIYRRRYESDRKVDRFVPGYVWENEQYIIPDSLEDYDFVVTLDGVFGDGMVNSTLDDLYRWDRALASGKLDTALLLTPGKTNDGESTEYAFGQGVRQHPKYGYTISHSGGWPGVVTYIYRFPETDRTLILLRNDGGGRNDRVNVLRNALHALHGMPLETKSLAPPKFTTVDVKKVEDLFGTYAVSPDFKFTFFASDDGKFMAQATGQSALQLGKHETEDRYAILEVNADIQFHRDETGKVTGLTLFQRGREIPAQREE